MQPLDRYQADLAAKLIEPDAEQKRVVGYLDDLYSRLQSAPPAEQSWLVRIWQGLAGKTAKSEPIKGLYVWGGVGRGKTYLMDMFYDCLPATRKQRTHFYRFMQQIHKSLAELQGETDPLRAIASRIAKETDVLCFDEFFVSDIGDAMILGGLLEALFNERVVLVATSNVKPDLLYENGLQRERFLPAIALLNDNTTVVEVAAGTDYRLERLSNSELYLYPPQPSLEEKLLKSFKDLAPDHLSIQENAAISILDRSIQSRFCSEDVVWFDFAELCEGPRSAFDYVEIAKLFHALILSGVPQLDDTRVDAARRFVSLIDELYDRRVKLIVAAEVALADLYVGTALEFEFERTSSRLVEMQSHDYLCASHRIL